MVFSAVLSSTLRFCSSSIRPGMSDFFQHTSKLVRNHAILSSSSSKATLLNILRAHPLLSPTYRLSGTSSLAEHKDFCAALLWVDASAFSAAAIKSLPADARERLCRLFGLTLMPNNSNAQAARIMHYVRTALAAASLQATTQVGVANAAAAGETVSGRTATGSRGIYAAAVMQAAAPTGSGAQSSAAGGAAAVLQAAPRRINLPLQRVVFKRRQRVGARLLRL